MRRFDQIPVHASRCQLSRDRQRAHGPGASPGIALGESPVAQEAMLQQALLGRVDLLFRITPALQLAAQLGARMIATDDHPETRVES